MRSIGDERGIITAWLVKFVLSLALTAVVLFDLGSIAVNFFTLDGTADDIAVELVPSGGRLTQADEVDVRERAKALAADSDARLVQLNIDAEGILHLKVRRTADTIIVKRIGFIKDWARATAEGQAGSI